jgi:hypothetical protein
MRAQGEESPSELESLRGGVKEDDEDDEEGEGEVTSPCHYAPSEELPLLGDLFGQQAGISVGVRQPN